MRRLAKPLAFLPALLAATPAFAVDTSFHTYDGFAETVDAFRLVSMIFADPRYETLVLIVATVGIGLGALLASVRGSGMGLVAFGFQILVGIGIFVGLIATTGTLGKRSLIMAELDGQFTEVPRMHGQDPRHPRASVKEIEL